MIKYSKLSLFIIIILISVNLPILPSSSESSPLSNPPPTGDWVVSDNTTINDTNLEVKGNITVTNTGKLELINVTLLMTGNITVHGTFIIRNVTILMNITVNMNKTIIRYGIMVESSGVMYVLDYDNDPATNDSSIISSVIKDGRHTYTFGVKDGAEFRIENSIIQEFGYIFFNTDDLDHRTGLFIDTNNVIIKNSTFNRSLNGVIFNSSVNNVVENSTFSLGFDKSSYDYGTHGLNFVNSDFNIIINCKFYNLDIGLLLHNSENNTISNCYFKDFVTKITIMRYTEGINNWYSNYNTVINNSFRMIYKSVEVYESNNLIYKNITINGTYNGFYFQYGCSEITLENIKIMNVYNPYTTPNSPPAPAMHFNLVNNNIKIINCTIESNETTLSDGFVWYVPIDIRDFYLYNCTVKSSSAALSLHSMGNPSFYSVSDILIENCSFTGNSHAFASIYRLNNWKFSNCTFNKLSNRVLYNFGNGIVSLADDLDNIKFNNCEFLKEKSQDNSNGIFINSNYNSISFNVSLTNCIVENNLENGIAISKQDFSIGGTLTIQNCTIRDNNKDGILWNDAYGSLNLNICNITNNNERGIKLQNLYNFKLNIENCNISGNDKSGILIQNSDQTNDINIINSKTNDNKFDGLETKFSICNLNLNGSDFSRNQRVGINTSDCSIDIERCNVSNNSQTGLNLISCSGEVNDNKISFNGYEGIVLYDCNEYIYLEKNQVHNNGLNMDVPECSILKSSPIIQDNIITTESSSSSRMGIKIEDSDEVLIHNNIFNGDFTESVIDISSSNAVLKNNQILKSGILARGLYCYDNSVLELINNTFSASGKYGILIYESETGAFNNNVISNWKVGLSINNTSILLVNNTITNSDYTGLHIERTAHAKLIDNTFTNNKNGILIEGSSELDNNLIRKTAGIGIWIKNKGEGFIYDNKIFGNDKGISVKNGKIISYNNLIDTNNIGMSLINLDDGIFYDDIIKDNDIGLEAEKSELLISRYSFINNNETILLTDSYCKISNSTILGLNQNINLDDDSYCQILNSEMTNASIEVVDLLSSLDREWFLNLTISDTESQPVSDALVIVKDRYGNEIFKVTTSIYGTINWLNLTSYNHSYYGQSTINPYEVVISKPGYGSTTNQLNFTSNMNISFTAYKLSELITQVRATDILNDEGGTISLTWNSIPILNFGNYNIYVDNEYIPSVGHLIPINSSIIHQETNSLIISEINGQPLENGKMYYFAITIVDSEDNEDWKRVVSSNPVIPRDNLPPKLIKNLTASDTPNDNGGSITITWDVATEPDFDYYILYGLSNSSSENFDINSLPLEIKIENVNTNIQTLKNLKDNNSYYFFILAYDINGNVNLSFNIIGPVSPFDNIPPLINREISTPSLLKFKVINSTEDQLFRIFLENGQNVSYQWYLDGIIQNNVTEEYLFLTMSDLTIGPHNVKVMVVEPSGLSDSVSWNFTIQEEPDTVLESNGTSELGYLWIILIIVIFLIIITLSFTVRHVNRYHETRKALKVLPTLENGEAIAFINKKREHGDKYILNKLNESLPEMYQNRPNKLFFILNILIMDDDKNIRENAAKNLAALLDKKPHNIFPWLRALQLNGMKPEIFLAISESSTNTMIKNIVAAYYKCLIAKNEDEYVFALASYCSALKDSESLKFGMEMNMIYTALNEFYKYRTISKISTSKPIIDRILNLRNWATEILNPIAIEIFYKLNIVADSLGKFEKVESIEDKLSYLSLGINTIEEATRFANDLIPPEKNNFLMVLTSWRNIISLSIRELRGRSDLHLNLIGKELVRTQDTMNIMLEIENKGRSVAEEVLVELVPSYDYVVLTDMQELGNIGYKKKKGVTFELRPLTNDSFRVEFNVHFDDAEKKDKSISFGDLITFIDMSLEFKNIPNPYIVGTPIQTGSKLFVGRRDLIDFIQKNIRGSLQENIIVLIGHRRTGKTTLLKQLPVYLDKIYIPVYIDIQGIIDPGMDAFFYLLANEIVTAMKNKGIDILQPEFNDFKERPSFHFEYNFLKEVNRKLGDSILILMFDEFEELEVKVDSGILDKNVFSYLRHLMQHTSQLAFIFTGSFKLEDLKTDYWSIMFNIAIYKRISFLSEDETRELIIDPVKDYNMIYDSLALEKIYRLTHGHPYFTQLLCHALVNLHNSERKNYITIQEVEHELTRIIERGQMHFDFIWDRSAMIERLVMTTVSRVLQEDETATISNIVNKLSEYNLTVDSKDISKTLDILASKDIINKTMDQTTTYEFKVDLIRIWLEQTKHLDQIVEEYRSGS
jgi:parallel beta-helix repeat protein